MAIKSVPACMRKRAELQLLLLRVSENPLPVDHARDAMVLGGRIGFGGTVTGAFSWGRKGEDHAGPRSRFFHADAPSPSLHSQRLESGAQAVICESKDWVADHQKRDAELEQKKVSSPIGRRDRGGYNHCSYGLLENRLG